MQSSRWAICIYRQVLLVIMLPAEHMVTCVLMYAKSIFESLALSIQYLRLHFQKSDILSITVAFCSTTTDYYYCYYLLLVTSTTTDYHYHYHY